jgi:glucose-6-phosphate 1-dehydrogenase
MKAEIFMSTTVARPRPTEAPEVPRAASADPCTMVIFGASGDLTKRKLLPALANLAAGGLLPDGFAVIAVARADVPEDAFRRKMIDDVREYLSDPTDPVVDWLARRLFYVRGEFQDDELYARLAEAIQRIEEQIGTHGNVLFYLATPPEFFAGIVEHLGQTGLVREEGGSWRRVIIEKPFGHDLASARALNAALSRTLKESQIYRIDHYLGKETVQNLMVFRFANGIFEPVWNRRYVDHVQITVAEAVGVEGRGAYYERAGALRDMVQNHLFQVLALTAMEPPNSFDADMVRDERVKALQAIRPYGREEIQTDVVRAQYTAGTIDGRPVVGYREEPHVDPRSRTETFVAMRVLLESWRWAGVPFYLRTGKRLAKRVSEIAIQFKSAPLMLFRSHCCQDQVQPNQLIVRIQPDEGIALRFQAKIPGTEIALGLVRMDFKYADYFGTPPSTGYETLLYDCMTGDSTLFHRADLIETGWKVVTPILEAWSRDTTSPIPTYPAGTWGPPEADALLARDGREWRKP